MSKQSGLPPLGTPVHYEQTVRPCPPWVSAYIARRSFWRALRRSSSKQGLTLVHFSAQPEPLLKQKHTLITPHNPLHPLMPPKQSLNAPPIPHKALKLS